MLEPLTNPFIVELAPGTERLDLSPIVMPILHAIREEIRDHERRGHFGNGVKKLEGLHPEDMYAYMVRAIEGVEYDLILNSINRAAIVNYLSNKVTRRKTITDTLTEHTPDVYGLWRK